MRGEGGQSREREAKRLHVGVGWLGAPRGEPSEIQVGLLAAKEVDQEVKIRKHSTYEEWRTRTARTHCGN